MEPSNRLNVRPRAIGISLAVVSTLLCLVVFTPTSAAAAASTLAPHLQISTLSGPAGAPITVVATGLGIGIYSASYHLYWDNTYVGYMTAVSTGGATNFTFYASGTPGAHYVSIYEGYPG